MTIEPFYMTREDNPPADVWDGDGWYYEVPYEPPAGYTIEPEFRGPFVDANACENDFFNLCERRAGCCDQRDVA